MSSLANQLAKEIRKVPATGWAEFEHARDEIVALGAQQAAAWEKLQTLRHEREQAGRADLEAFADAIRAGEKAPKIRAVDKADQAIAEETERLEALKVAISRAAADLETLISERQSDWIAGLEEEITPALDAYRAKTLEMVAAREALLRAWALRSWLLAIDAGHAHYRGGSPPLHALRGSSGDSMNFQRVVDALLVDLEPEAPSPALHIAGEAAA